MAPKQMTVTVFSLSFFLLTFCRSTTVASQPADFTSILRSALDEIQKLQTVLSTVPSPLLGFDRRLSSAIQDCTDVLSLSSDELEWALSSASAPSSSVSAELTLGTGRRLFDLVSWLSAAAGNQDTCAEGFDGAGGIVKNLVGAGLSVVTSLVHQALTQIPEAAAVERGGASGKNRRLLEADGFPAWIGPAGRRLLQAPAASLEPDVVVAADGSGNYMTVGEAVEAAPEQSESRFVIYVKSGVYNENVEIKRKKWNIVLVGDGMGATVITGDRNFVDGWTTFRTATLAVVGRGFIMRDLTVENTAGPAKHQAVALRSSSDLSAYFRVEFAGYQDTLYAHSLRQFYRECRVSGTVDFVFGNSAAVFQSCAFVARRPLPNQKNSVTAHGRKFEEQNTGFSIQACNVTFQEDEGSEGMAPPPTYLGRPWKEYSRTVVLQSYLGKDIRPEGWLEWAGNFALATLYYGEYMNSGPGSPMDGRVKWPGFHVISDAAVAVNFTVAQLIDGDRWLPPTGVRYVSGLTQ